MDPTALDSGKMLAMVTLKNLPVLFFLGTAASLATMVSSAQSSQQTPLQAASKPASARVPYSAFSEIHVDQRCRLLPNPALLKAGEKKQRPHGDPVICHLETILSSSHMEETAVGNEVRRSQVSIREQEYVLQNITTEPRLFVVEQLVPAGWVVDSDPQPTEMDKNTAVFRLHAKPGEIVRLHVGIRHAKPLHPELLKTGPPARSGMQSN